MMIFFPIGVTDVVTTCRIDHFKVATSFCRHQGKFLPQMYHVYDNPYFIVQREVLVRDTENFNKSKPDCIRLVLANCVTKY